MKTGKKLFSALLAAGILMSQTAFAGIASAADTEPVATHGDYYAIYPNQDGTFTGGTITTNAVKEESGYSQEQDAYKAHAENASSHAIENIFSETLDRSKYKYAALAFMYDGATWGGSNFVGWMLHYDKGLSNSRKRERSFADETPNVTWEKHVVNLDEFIPESTFTRTNFFMIWRSGTFVNGESYTVDGYPTFDCYEKYMAFFENEEDANAYDLSIKKYSINGLEANVDNVAHTITYKLDGLDSSIFENAEPVITQDPLAAVTKTSGDIDYINPITYSVQNVLGETIEYTVNFDYGQGGEVDGQYVISFDSAVKVSATPLKFYNWHYPQDEDYSSFDPNTNSLQVNEQRYGGALGVVIDKEIPDLNKYKYMKIKYRYDAKKCSNGTSYFGSKVSLNKTSGHGVTLRDNFGYAFVSNGTVPGYWFTDIADISSLSRNADADSRIRFTAGFNERDQRIRVSYRVKYIALFENYADAVNYDSEAGFTGISMSNIKGKSIRSAFDYYEDGKTPDMMTVLYKDGKVESIIHADAPSYVELNEAGTAYEFNDGTSIDTTTTYGGIIKEDAEKGVGEPSSFMAERTATLSTNLSVTGLADGNYTAKTFVWTTEEMKPYCTSESISFTMENGTMTVK